MRAPDAFVKLTPSRRLVLVAVAALFASWLGVHFARLTNVQDGGLRFALGLLLAAAVLLRPDSPAPRFLTAWACLGAGLLGACASTVGIVLRVGQFEWLGLLLLLAGCLGWALPGDRRGNVLPALTLLYWVHPMPSQVFAPLQFTAQALSVQGAEWLLHVLNVRVWADGFVLRTGVALYEVPAWCSGMRTATTVLILALGLGMLKRLSVIATLLLALAAIAQAIALNVVRLAAMVIFAPRVTHGVGVVFLHDTAGLIVVGAVAIVYAEACALAHRAARHHAKGQELNPVWMRRLSEHPPTWRRILQHRWLALSALAGLLLLAALAYKGRTQHRAEMIKDVVAALRDTRQFELAHRAALQVQALQPADEEWQMTILRLLLMRGEYRRVLRGLDAVPDRTPERAAQKTVLRAYCHLGLGHMAQAAEHVALLPEQVRREDPRVAMILAEMARFGNDPDGVTSRLKTATVWAPNMPRVRAMYPYLRQHRRWQSIMETDAPLPYSDASEALCVIEAAMNLNLVPRVASLTLEVMRAWPQDPRVMEPLFFLASRKQEGQWEEQFAVRLKRQADMARDPAILHPLFDKCFALSRPDLAWHVYRRLAALDPAHPALALQAARHGHEWFRFRSHLMGVEAGRTADTVDLRLPARCALALRSWRALGDAIPCARELAAANRVEARKAYLAQALAEFSRRLTAGQLSLPLRFDYALALEMGGRADEARSQYDAIAAEFPAERSRVRMAISELYERRGDWQQVYEALRGYLEEDERFLEPILRLSRAQAQLRFGAAAIHTAKRATELYPSSSQAVEALASALNRFDSPEEALLVAARPRVRDSASLTALEILLLHRSQRFTESQSLSRSALVAPLPLPPATVQRPYLPPAEAALQWPRFFVPTREAFARNAEWLLANRERATSPMVRHLGALWLNAWSNGCANGSAEADRWLAGARDDTERAALLSQLALLLCRKGELTAARPVARRAAEYMPDAPLLWRAAVGLAGPDRDLIALARRACPDDSELWLAELVVTTQFATGRAKPPPWCATNAPAAAGPLPTDVAGWSRDFVRLACARAVYSPAAMARAADYLYRGGLREAAGAAARQAARDARGLLPAHVVGLRAAIEERDFEAAVGYTREAIAAALQPPPILYEKFVTLKAERDPIDTGNDMVEALKVLRRTAPRDPLWAQMLGYVRFQRGGWEVIDALEQMTAAIEHGATNRTPYLVAAESARLLDQLDRSEELLRDGMRRWPADLELRNNLVFTLALQSGRVDEALELLPGLLKEARANVEVLDTASAVYTRAKLLDRAEETLGLILPQVQPGSRSWFRAQTRAAEVRLLRGDAAAAVAGLRPLLRHSTQMPGDDVLAVTRLLTEAQECMLAATNRPPQPAPGMGDATEADVPEKEKGAL